MGLYLIAASLDGILTSVWQLGAVCLGLGLVIFVHELGHFAVAKWCGVKCEKFYLGFDIGGKKIFAFQYGETEYGIGVLPLGGYVKMLGQEDNPARMQEEMEKAKIRKDAGEATDEDEAVLDPRSYLAMSVPKRMAIISAGVIMNMIFAYFVFAGAYLVGVTLPPPVVSTVIPGDPAWVAGVEMGDTVLEIEGVKARNFGDIMKEVALSSASNPDGVHLKLKREGVKDPINVTIPPDRTRERPMIGVAMPRDLKLVKSESVPPVMKYTPAANTQGASFEAGDRIVEVAGKPVDTFAQYARQMVAVRDKQITIKVLRDEKEIPVVVAARPMKVLGIEMQIGEISAIRQGSPADKAGLQVGDRITGFNGESVGNPMTLPYRMAKAEMVSLEVMRREKDGEKTHILQMKHEPWTDFDGIMAFRKNLPVPVNTLGFAYQVLNRINDITLDSPAAASKVKLEGEIVAAEFLPTEEDKEYELEFSKDLKIEFADDDQDDPVHWPYFFARLQVAAPKTKVKLTLKDGKSVTLLPAESQKFFLDDRGLNCQGLAELQRAESTGEAFQWANTETFSTLGMVYRFLARLITNDISPTNMGGPGRIFQAAWGAVDQGMGDLMMFLAMLSVNLAVINFLPIPVLDGGHMAFLLWEGIRGKPAPERWTVLAHMAGFALILCLILFVIILDTTALWPG